MKYKDCRDCKHLEASLNKKPCNICLEQAYKNNNYPEWEVESWLQKLLKLLKSLRGLFR